VLFGEAIALLAGDALLALAFEIMAETPPELATRALRIVKLLGLGSGSRDGLMGGQSLEGELLPESAPPVSMGSMIRRSRAKPADLLDRYHYMKTGAMFRLATEAGATVAGVPDVSGWALVGQDLGLAYQLADDLYDVCGWPEVEGKPVRQDIAHGRPNAALVNGVEVTRARLGALLVEAQETALRIAMYREPVVAMFAELTRQVGRLVG
jgi:geranylgeranyl pyrophosphate synthase